MKVEYWVKNRSDSDLISSELSVKIPRGKVVNLAQLNPELSHDRLRNSEENGFLHKCFVANKLIKLPMAPVKQQAMKPMLTEAVRPIPSRVKTAIVMNVKELDYIEELSNFDTEVVEGRYSEGFADPMRAEGEAGVNEFGAVVIPAKDSGPDQLPGGNPVKTKPVKSGTRINRHVQIEADEE